MWDVGVGFGSGILIVYKCDLARDLLGEKADKHDNKVCTSKYTNDSGIASKRPSS